MAKGMKTGGKQKGSKNKKTQQWEEFGHNLTSSGVERAKRIMAQSNDKDFMFYFQNLLNYFKPQLSRTAITDPEGDALKFAPPTIVLTVGTPHTNGNGNGHSKE